MPTTQQQLSYIREKCIEANPSIKDLVFGCELYIPNHVSNKSFGGKKCTFVKKQDVRIDVLWEGDSHGGFHETTVFEIIGRPIRLADILLVIPDIGKSLYVAYTGEFFQFDNFPENIDGKDRHIVSYADAEWNLKSDHLTSQSPETISFIASLLGYKE